MIVPIYFKIVYFEVVYSFNPNIQKAVFHVASYLSLTSFLPLILCHCLSLEGDNTDTPFVAGLSTVNSGL